MYSLNDIKQLLNLDNKAIEQLELQFKSPVEQALQNFSSKTEAEALLKRTEEQRIIDKRVEYVDFNLNRGGAPITYWKKACPFCFATFETTNRKRVFCEAPGHRQRFHEQKKSAKLFIYLQELIAQQTSGHLSNAPSRVV